MFQMIRLMTVSLLLFVCLELQSSHNPGIREVDKDIQITRYFSICSPLIFLIRKNNPVLFLFHICIITIITFLGKTEHQTCQVF